MKPRSSTAFLIAGLLGGPGCGDPSEPQDPSFAVPAPLRPWNGEMTGSAHASGALRPRFQWRAVAGATSYHLQVDDSCPTTGFAACRFASPEIDARDIAAAELTPGSNLPVATTQPVGRRYFWRVRACHAAGCSPWSAVRYVDVGRMAQDLNGDGYGDVVVGADPGAAGTGKTYIYFGKAGPLAATPDVTLTVNEQADGFGYFVQPAGDVNADGYPDLIDGAYTSNAAGARAGRTYLYLGGKTPHTTPEVTLTGKAAGELFGIAVSSAGDMNGDGYADYAVGASGLGPGRVELHFGGATLDAVPDVELTGAADGDFFGYPLAPVADVNGDGFADLAVSSTAAGPGRAYVFLGGAAVDARPDVTLDGEGDGDSFGGGLGGPGDVNGDGFADVAVSAYLNDVGAANAGRLYLYLGAAALDTTADFRASVAAADANLGAVALVDLNADGQDDIAVATNVVNGQRTFIYLGGAAPHVMPDLSIAGTDVSFSMACGGDVNGDGFNDLVVGATGATAVPGHVYVYYGARTPAITPATNLVAPAPDDGFGISVF